MIVESYPLIPHEDVEKVIRDVDFKVCVVHDQRKDEFGFNPYIFDYIVFDERFAKEVISSENVVVISYPCHPIVEGRRRFAEDKLRFFTFGRQPIDAWHN